MSIDRERRRSARGRRERTRERDKQTKSPPKRALKPVELLGEEDVERVHRSSLQLLRDVGLEFKPPEAWGILEREGAVVDRDTGMVRFDPDSVEQWLARAPASFSIGARNPD